MAGATATSTRSSSTRRCRRTRRCGCSCTSSHTASESATATTDAAAPTGSAAPPATTASTPGAGCGAYGRRGAEVLVDTVTHIVCGSVGLDISASSVPYVAGWGETGELDAIRGYAETIDKIARRIEDSLTHEQTPQAVHDAPLAA